MEGSQPDTAHHMVAAWPQGGLTLNPDAVAQGILAWWRDAGVDLAFQDEPVDWLGAAPNRSPTSATSLTAEKPRAAASPEPRPAVLVHNALPAALADFTGWWMTEPSLDGGAVQGRVPPRGRADAELMIVVAHPEAADDGQLLSGPEGALLSSMVGAMGFDMEAAYVASVIPRHMPLPDWPALASAGFGRVLGHHIRLAAPKRLIVLGRHILPLIGNDPPHNTQSARHFNHEGFSVPLLGGMELASLLAQPRRKAVFWQQWLDWTEMDGKITA